METKKEKTLQSAPPGLATGALKLIIGEDMFNYFVAAVGYKVVEHQLQVKMVEYNPKPRNKDKEEDEEEKPTYQIRVPGGSFDPDDLIEVINKLDSEIISTHKKNELKRKIEMEVGYARMDKSYKEEDHMVRAKYAKNFSVIVRSFFIPGQEDKLEVILKNCILQTLKREMEDEVSGEFTSATLVFDKRLEDGHCKYTAVINDLKGPDSTKGSGDLDIISSEYMSADLASRRVWGGHRVVLRSGLLHIRELMKEQKETAIVNNLNSLLA